MIPRYEAFYMPCNFTQLQPPPQSILQLIQLFFLFIAPRINGMLSNRSFLDSSSLYELKDFSK